MRWSIRNQILVPLVAIQGAAVCATALATAGLAARRGERQVIDRLNGVVEALGHASFPYNGAVLARMRGLSGAEFVAQAADGRVTAASAPGLESNPPPAVAAGAGRLESLGAAPAVEIAGVRYLAVRLPPGGRGDGASLLVLYPETSWRQARREAAEPPLWLGGGSLVAMTLVTGWIAHRIGRRLRRVNREVARIAAGHFEGLEPGPEADEVADLVASVNTMCLRLRDLSRTERRSERTRLLAQLAAGLAHQLRNALTGARLSLQLHARRCPGAAGDRTLEVALRQLALTEEQVKGLLSLGRVEDRPAVACDLSRLLADVALLVGPACEHARVALVVGPADDPPRVTADGPGLRAAVLNLALNAVEAAGPGGTVRLAAVAVADADASAVEVRDTGPGPPAELADALFEPFSTGKPEGVGLGLALAHQVATRHGGTLAWSREHDETCFRLTLPRADRAAAGASAPAGETA